MTPEELERLLAAFRREDDYIDALSDEFYLTKVRVYEDTLSALLGDLGYDNEDVQVSTEVAQALSDEADAHAEIVARTYNREMENFVRKLGALGVPYEQAAVEVAEWSEQRDESRAEMIAVTEAYTSHADATILFFLENGIEVPFDFGGHRHDLPAACPVCIALERSNPHPLERVLEIGSPHINCRQSWHARLEDADLPDEVSLALEGVAGIVGKDPLVNRAGGLAQAVQQIEET